MRRLLHWFVIAMTLIVLSCSSESDAGESCDSPGGTNGVCEDGTVCGYRSSKSGQLTCILRCSEGGDCPKDFECKEAVEKANVEGCRFKD
jgi:hypothetical protein